MYSHRARLSVDCAALEDASAEAVCGDPAAVGGGDARGGVSLTTGLVHRFLIGAECCGEALASDLCRIILQSWKTPDFSSTPLRRRRRMPRTPDRAFAWR